MAGRVHDRRAEDRAAVELRELVMQLERSGLAERRADVRRLLEESRSLLHARHHPALAGGLPLRAAPSGRKLAGKLGALLNIALDVAVLLAIAWGGVSILAHRGSAPDLVVVLAGAVWVALRLPFLREGLREAGCRLLYYLAWGFDWIAEAFSRAAMDRLSARLAAREVMWSWRQHRRALLHRPEPRDVQGFLELVHGVTAAEAFGHAAARIDGRAAAERLEALRWSVLIRLFEGLAAAGALWPAGLPDGQPAPAAPPQPSAEPSAVEPPEATQRRHELRDIIRRKRQDISTAYGWKLKTQAEISQRDGYIAETRQEIAALERELAGLGE